MLARARQRETKVPIPAGRGVYSSPCAMRCVCERDIAHQGQLPPPKHPAGFAKGADQRPSEISTGLHLSFYSIRFQLKFHLVFAVGIRERNFAFIVSITISWIISSQSKTFHHAGVYGNSFCEILIVKHVSAHVIIDNATRHA